MVIALLILLVCSLLFLAAQQIYFAGKRKGVSNTENALELVRITNDGLLTELENKKREYAKLLNQKKSSEVRTGRIAEQLAPFLEGFKYDSKCSRFLGEPVDFVVFDENGVHFVEVKSGAAQLTRSQKDIRDHIENGRVSFEIYRIKGD